MKKISITVTLALLIFGCNSAIAQTQQEKITVQFNQTNIVVNGKHFNADNLVYKGTTYLPIRSLAELWDLEVNYYEATKTAYIGQLPVGEVPTSVINQWEKEAANIMDSENIQQKSTQDVDAIFNDITVKVHGDKIEANNIVINGRTFVPMRAALDILGIPIGYNSQTATAFIGEFTEFQLTTKLYTEPAIGKRKGMFKLKGHEFEHVANIYYRVEGSMLRVESEDIREVDLNKLIAWTDDKGKKRTNTVGEIYEVFGTFSEYTSDWFLEHFGDLYTDWISVSTINAEKIVSDYLDKTGELKITNKVTLTPDAVLVFE
ncbi:copper amine oxidase N-terminal domain-containing protein [Paenibacillus sp. N1-5-1-14]|uniref:copper amine oxidase N-terminal domain-containing protein n=1 Tax=Paenibacillus radicibacter TaxID=2972488 RepID=UPI0021595D44|nr:copper amine oxidase N-terminal domain-containing protein [Paenibacillus radicibacter]MCR8645139.1 copper amine oxidase N-terminal domain-containing protein [Paenibacillus radicibacter]